MNAPHRVCCAEDLEFSELGGGTQKHKRDFFCDVGAKKQVTDDKSSCHVS
jgi:hypothetical protein